MRQLAIVLSIVIGALGATGLVSPDTMANATRPLEGRYAAAAIRLILGGALALAAPASRAPRILRVVGVGYFLAGLATPFLGLVLGPEIDLELHDWWVAQGPLFIRIWAGFALAVASVLMVLLWPTRRLASR